MKIQTSSPDLAFQLFGDIPLNSLDAASPDVFPGFEFQDDAGPGLLYDADMPAFPADIIIEAYSQTSQYDRILHCSFDHPVVAIAIDGRGFHGKYGRTWHTYPGNFYLTCFFPFQKGLARVGEASPYAAMATPYASTPSAACGGVRDPDPGACLPWYQAAPCVALAESLPPGTRIKWPNDLVTETPPRKLGGILTALTATGVCYGIGINLVKAPDPDDTNLLLPASVAPALCDPERVRVGAVLMTAVSRLALRVAQVVQDPIALLSDYRRDLAFVGRHIALRDARSARFVASGIFEGIDDAFCARIQGDPHPYANVDFVLSHVQS